MNTKRKPRVIRIHGRRWVNTNGSTYHTVSVWVDGEHVHDSERHYGYGTHYEQTAKTWLSLNGYLPGLTSDSRGICDTLWRYCDDRGIKYVSEVTNVGRRKDL